MHITFNFISTEILEKNLTSPHNFEQGCRNIVEHVFGQEWIHALLCSWSVLNWLFLPLKVIFVLVHSHTDMSYSILIRSFMHFPVYFLVVLPLTSLKIIMLTVMQFINQKGQNQNITRIKLKVLLLVYDFKNVLSRNKRTESDHTYDKVDCRCGHKIL